jgi:hypothetical protein
MAHQEALNLGVAKGAEAWLPFPATKAVPRKRVRVRGARFFFAFRQAIVVRS